ncbi:hypothetical protein GCM10010168_21990 [Actinoplanes ianthinogenes]|uniref:Uncharacterized protein n=1 Tax=Actinoplanes ianthinogenes TaxID=122358 RepID=A0ABM7M850_9ACTN|nr:hypothetical protein [Actinoplanes ianthinogenes]BCJ47840.1 hypothetical protein Aiant_84970 [Actinoplanes ianthinogenes]GGR04526.1 hypothetical protein GCM10010168_21990 [Actinoplanes ianthinogenes]
MRDSVARARAELRQRVGEHLDEGETLRAAVWIARDSGLPLISRITPWKGAATPRKQLDGTAAELDRHLPDHTAAAALALTEARLLLMLDGPPLAPVWQCPRAALATATATDPEGQLTLHFTDGSRVTVVAPFAHLANDW